MFWYLQSLQCRANNKNEPMQLFTMSPLKPRCALIVWTIHPKQFSTPQFPKTSHIQLNTEIREKTKTETVSTVTVNVMEWWVIGNLITKSALLRVWKPCTMKSQECLGWTSYRFCPKIRNDNIRHFQRYTYK